MSLSEVKLQNKSQLEKWHLDAGDTQLSNCKTKIVHIDTCFDSK